VAAEGQTIGYRRDRQQISGESQKNLVASERRKTMAVQVALYESESGKVVSGPFRIEGYADFDYVDGDSIQDLVFIAPNGVRQVVLPFSLGQLESSEAAEEAAMRPLHVQIAKKIIDSIYSGLDHKKAMTDVRLERLSHPRICPSSLVQYLVALFVALRCIFSMFLGSVSPNSEPGCP
jgi:hypothetical protein